MSTHDQQSMVALRPGLLADAGGICDASDALQELVDSTAPYGTVELPPGVYLLGRPLVISRPLTLTTRGRADSNEPIASAFSASYNPRHFATLKAAPTLLFRDPRRLRDQHEGLLCIRPSEHEDLLADVQIHHLIFDGNARARREAAGDCRTCDQFNCANVNAQRCRNLEFRHNVSIDGCTGGNDPYANLFIDTPGLWLYGNLFSRHGDVPIGWQAPSYLSSTTVHQLATNSLEIQANSGDVPDLWIADNLVFDPSNLGIVLRPGTDRTITGEVTRNEIKQQRNMNWGAALLLYGQGSFGDGTRQDSRNTLLVHHNRIDGNSAGATIPGTRTRLRMAPFGIQIGTRPYGPAPDVLAWRVEGGRIFANFIDNTQVGINVDGAGTVSAPVVVVDNETGPGVGLAFNKAPRLDGPCSGNVVLANESLETEAGFTRQTGPLVLSADEDRQLEGWGSVPTHEQCAWGCCPALIAVAPKPIGPVVADLGVFGSMAIVRRRPLGRLFSRGRRALRALLRRDRR
ncbi:hypothetical protein [Tautonia rosea]|uniref:hypothetical protein n=1 Tax=Tautonia rosea TaxID=2728037 RepID=UPI0014766117|nr:hypothetical protein [Tautonia rosea]